MPNRAFLRVTQPAAGQTRICLFGLVCQRLPLASRHSIRYGPLKLYRPYQIGWELKAPLPSAPMVELRRCYQTYIRFPFGGIPCPLTVHHDSTCSGQLIVYACATCTSFAAYLHPDNQFRPCIHMPWRLSRCSNAINYALFCSAYLWT